MKISIIVFTLLINFLLISAQKKCMYEFFDFSLQSNGDGFYTLKGTEKYKDDFSQILKTCQVYEVSGAQFFNNCNDDCCWYVDLNSANVKMGHNSRMIDLVCEQIKTSTTDYAFNCKNPIAKDC